ncbi:MAG: SagB family peptide dehydrogenase [Dermatophilaceae bacterium]
MLETLTVTTVLAIRASVALESTDGGLMVRGTSWQQRVEVPDPAVVRAILDLVDGPAAAEEVVRRAMIASGQLAAAVVAQRAIKRLQQLGVFEHVLFEPGGDPIATLTTEGAQPVALLPLPADVVTRGLSPHAVATVSAGGVVVQSGASHLQVILRPDLYATLATGDLTRLPEPVLAMLCTARLLLTQEEQSSRRVRQWHAADLWFHRRNNESRGADGYGGTYHLAADFDPLPYTRPVPDGVSPVDLPVPDLATARHTDPPLADVMERRRSRRVFQGGATTLDQLGALLYRSLRVRQVHPDDHGLDVVDRPYPSGGSVHEIETYVVANDIAGLAPGVYRYAPERHQLDPVTSDPVIRARVNADVQMTTRGAIPPPFALIFAARFGRLMWKYQGMPYSLLTKHVGVVYQTIYLNAEPLGLGVCGIGGTSLGLFAAATGADPLEEGAVGMMVLGSFDPAEADPWGRP